MHALSNFHLHPPSVPFRFFPAKSFSARSISSSSNYIFTNTMSSLSSSLVLPSSLSLRQQHHQQQLAFGTAESLKNSSFLGFKNGVRGFSLKNLEKSRVSMSVAVGSQTVASDVSFKDYKPTCAFLFPGQVTLQCSC